MPNGMCYSHFGNEVRNGEISITQRSFINDRYKVNPVGQWGKILVMAMGFVRFQKMYILLKLLDQEPQKFIHTIYHGVLLQ